MITRETLEKRYKGSAWPSVFVLHGKHDNDYFLAYDIGQFLRAVLLVVTQRFEEGYYHEPTAEDLRSDVTDEVLAVLPASMRSEILYNRKVNLRLQKDYRQAQETWQTLQTALAGDHLAAFQVLDDRKDHEYEGWDLERLTVA